MNNVINVNEHVRAFSAPELGDMIQRGLFKQVGVIRTEYVTVNGAAEHVRGRSIEAVIFDRHLNKLYAVEQYRGLAIRAEIRDEEMLEAMHAMIPQLEDGEGFTYDQRIHEGTEEIDTQSNDNVQAQVNKVPEAVFDVSASV